MRELDSVQIAKPIPFKDGRCLVNQLILVDNGNSTSFKVGTITRRSKSDALYSERNTKRYKLLDVNYGQFYALVEQAVLQALGV